jgi:excisionase family DNA binding protein
VAKSKSGEFYTFDEVLRQLSIDENRLKRLVSEGEIRAFREGDQMKFKRAEIDNLAGRGGRGATSDTSLTDITIEEETTTVRKGRETLTDDLLNEPDLTKRGGMKTAEISSQDTFIDQGGDVGMSTEPIDFTEEVGEEAEEVSDIGVTKVRRTTTTTARGPAPTRAVVLVEPKTSAAVVAGLILTALVAICAGFVVVSIARGRSTELSQFFAKTFHGDAYRSATPAPPPANP